VTLAASLPPPGASVAVLAVQVALLLALALWLGRLCRRVGVPGLLGELSAGLILGPSVLGGAAPGLHAWLFPATAEQRSLLNGISQLAVLLVVGFAGLHVDRMLLRRQTGLIACVALPAFALPLLAGVGFGLLLPVSLLPGGADRMVFALFLGVTLSLSAVPVAAHIFRQLGVLDLPAARIALACAVVIDAGAWVLLAGVTARASNTGGLQLVLGGVVGIVVVVGIVACLPRMLDGWLARPQRSAAAGARVLSTPAAVTLVFAGAAATASLGLEGLLGAFAVGVALSACQHLDLAGIRSGEQFVTSVLAPLFFAGVGLQIDVRALDPDTDLALCATLVLVAVVSKLLGAGAGALAAGTGAWPALTVASALNARGAVELIVADLGLRLGILDHRWHAAIAVVAIVTSMMTAPLLRWSILRGAPVPLKSASPDGLVPPGRSTSPEPVPLTSEQSRLAPTP
jgi:Kef-type K+ transport system membrane component KefB